MDLPAFDKARILVAGDVILDRYWSGDASRISREAPVPVVQVRDLTERPGGAGNVAVNLTALGARTVLAGLVGDDEAGAMLATRLTEAKVEPALLRLPEAATITKIRVLSKHQQLIRLDFDHPFLPALAARLLEPYRQHLAEADAVVLSDYGQGTLREIGALIEAARAADRPVLVDPVGRDFSIYRGATVLKPNRLEFEEVVGECATEVELRERGQRLMSDLQLDALLVTRGEQGMTLMRAGREAVHLPAQGREVFDVTGAGDTVIAVLAAGLGAGLDLEDATRLANAAAGLVVGKLGAATVSGPEIHAALHAHQADHRVMDEEALLAAVAGAHARGEKVVMTNGCFDILHAGHVAYLETAKGLGDRLVVAVNDDDSVRRLKGEGRPVNPLVHRMAVLAGLASVDWVVAFSEDTPQRLICRVQPDVLVKGGDYRIEDVDGADCVREAGGRVTILDYQDGLSTTRLIDAIRGGRDEE